MELATLNFDTYEIVKQLQANGYTEEQASGFVEAIQRIKLSGAATRQDIQDVRTELQDVRDELKKDVQELRNEMKDEFRSQMKFQIIQTVAIIGVMVTLLSFFG
jgi:uncharacterized membrane protein